MSFNDFQNIFSTLDISKYQDNYLFDSVVCTHNSLNNYHLVKMTVNKSGEHTIGIT